MPTAEANTEPSGVVSSGQIECLRENDVAEAARDSRGMSAFLSAVQSGTTETVMHLIAVSGAQLGDVNDAGMTCLHLAAERGQGGVNFSSAAAMLTLLLESGAGGGGRLPKIDARDRQNFTPLHVACMCGDVAAARCLLRRGADVGAVNDKGSTPVHWACSRGHTKIVKLLVGTYGSEFALPANNGSTPLHWAASKNKRRVARLLLGTYCAQVDVKDDKGCTPALMAALNGHIKMVELLIDRFHAKITLHDKKRTSLLHAACEMGHEELANFLIEQYGMAVEGADRKGLTPLARAALRNQVEVFRQLVDKHGARLDTVTTRKSGLLHVACEGGAVDTAKLLLHEYGFDVDARNADGDTPVLIAASRGHAEVLALLVETHGASLEASDARGAGALHKACQGKQAAAAATVLLESYGVPADKADPSGTTPLHLAARGGDASLAELLTGPTGRADPGLRDSQGNQALHIAAACGHLDVVKVMVEKAGADLQCRNASEKSALDVAVGKANTDIADYLRGVLPDRGEHHDQCERRSGFKRAGRWLGLGRAAGYLQNLSLENVYLLPVPELVRLGRFPSHYDATRKKVLVPASDIAPYAQVLFVSHPWESPGNPDPSGRQFSALMKFLEQSKAEEEGDCGTEGFGYVWAAFSCTSSNRIKPTFKVHLQNVLTAWCFADHVLVLPKTITVRRSDGFACTDLKGYTSQGWCCVELLCVAHLGVPTTLHLALADKLWEGTPTSGPGYSVVLDVPDDVDTVLAEDTTNSAAKLNSSSTNDSGSGSNSKMNDHVGYVFQPIATPSPAAARTGASTLDNDLRDKLETEASETSRSSSGLTLGQCVSRAIESASKRLGPFFTRETDKIDPERVRVDSQGTCGDPNANLDSKAAAARLLRSGERSVNNDGASGDGIDRSVHMRQQVAEMRDFIRPDMDVAEEPVFDTQNYPDSQKDHDMYAVADLFWSSEAESYLDSISDMVATLLTTVDKEASKFTAEDDPPTPTSFSPTGGGVFPVRRVAIDVQADVAVPPRDGEEAALLLGRVLSLSLGKQDVEDEVFLEKKRDEDEGGGKVGAGGKEALLKQKEVVARPEELRTLLAAGNVAQRRKEEEEKRRREEEGFKSAVLLRELHDKLGSFASGNEKVEAVNTLLLAGCYCKGISSLTGGSGGSPKRQHRGLGTRVGAPPPPPPGISPGGGNRQRSPLSPEEGSRGSGRGSPPPPPPPALANSVPSCGVS